MSSFSILSKRASICEEGEEDRIGRVIKRRRRDKASIYGRELISRRARPLLSCMFVKGLAANEKRVEGEKEVAERGSKGCVGQ